MTESKKNIYFLAAAACLYFILKTIMSAGVYNSNPEKLMEPDSYAYEYAAVTFAERGVVMEKYESGERPLTYRTPGYPLFMGLIYRIFGQNRLAVVIIQNLLSCLFFFAVYYLLRFLSDTPVPVKWLSLLIFLNLPMFYYSQVLLTELLFTLLFTAALLSALRLITLGGKGLAALTGALLAFSVLVRPVTYYIFLPAAIYYAAYLIYDGLGFKKIAVQILCFLLPAFLFIGGWRARNYFLTGSSEFATIRGEAAYSIVVDVLAIKEKRGLQESDEKYYESFHEGLEGLSRAESSGILAARSLRAIKANPIALIKSSFKGFLRMFFVPGEAELMKFLSMDTGEGGPAGDLLRLRSGDYAQKWFKERIGHFILFFTSILYLAVLYCGVIASFYNILKSRGQQLFIHALLWLAFLYIVAITVPGYRSYVRFRLPVESILIAYSVLGWRQIMRFAAKRAV